MKYQEIINLLDNTPNQLSKFSTKNSIEIKDHSKGMYYSNSDIIVTSSLCDYSDVYILVKGRITITRKGADDAARQADERDKGIIFKNHAPFINVKVK